MNIQQVSRQKIQPTPQFQAIRRIKCSTEEFLKLQEKYQEFFSTSKGTRMWFKSESIHHSDVYRHLLEVATKLGESPVWLLKNCKQHGINLPNAGNSPLFEFTEESVLKLIFFRLKTICPAFCFGLKNSSKVANEVPQHLISLKIMNDFANKIKPKFEKFLEKNQVEDLTLEEYIKTLKQ